MAQAVAVMPVHDPDGLVLPHLRAVAPPLRQVFREVLLGITQPTRDAQAGHVRWLEQEGFFQTRRTPVDVPIGHQFLSLYDEAVECYPGRVVHLCFPDRVVFALQTVHRDAFIADMQAVKEKDAPLLFQRSNAAWQTHPQNYREIEQMAIRVGEFALGRALELTWCHLVVQARQLRAVLPRVRNADLSMLAEIVLHLKEQIHTRDVDWLAWEDPFIHSRDAEQLRSEREESPEEAPKRLAYVIPVLQLLAELGSARADTSAHAAPTPRE